MSLYIKIKEHLTHEAKTLGTISIGKRIISNNTPVFVIAEAASNHMCDLELAKQMIDKASEAGVDAIKFQTYKAEKLVTKDATAFWGNETISQIEYYKKLDLFGKPEFEELFKYAVDKGIIGFSSPFDAESSDMLNELGMPLFKIASCDIPNIQHIRQIANFKKPIILSTGASTVEEIDRAIYTIFKEDNFQLILLACTLNYPTPYHQANFRRIQTLKERYPELTIGISDHTEPDPNMIAPAVAVSLGARVIEKHYTLDKRMTGSGHFFAMSPNDLKMMVENVRITQTMLGEGNLGVAEGEEKAWKSARRSIVADIFIPKGTIIKSDMLGFKRPAIGISASKIDDIVGKKTICDLPKDHFLSWEDIE
jgi:sialic acid synthase SpsE